MSNKIAAAWSRFWFADAPYFDLAFIRIIAVAMQCFYLLDQQFATLEYVLSLPHQLYHPPYTLWPFILPWGITTPPDAQIIHALYWTTVVFGFMALFGLLTYVSMITFAIGSILLQIFAFSFGDYHHPEAILLIALLVISLAPSGKVRSLDSFLRRRRGTHLPMVPLLEASGPYAGWPIKFVQCLFPLVYISAVLAKIGPHFNFDWVNGYTLQYYFIQDDIRKGSPLALWASQFHVLIYLSQIIVIAFQLTYFLIVPFKKLRWVSLRLGRFWHLANYLIL
jgi:hypothetical protein